MIQLINGIRIPTNLKDCSHLACAECGYKSNDMIVHAVFGHKSIVLYKNGDYDYHLCKHRTQFIEKQLKYGG